MTIRTTIESAVSRYLRLPEEADDCADEVIMALEAAGIMLVPVVAHDAAQIPDPAVGQRWIPTVGKAKPRTVTWVRVVTSHPWGSGVSYIDSAGREGACFWNGWRAWVKKTGAVLAKDPTHDA